MSKFLAVNLLGVLVLWSMTGCASRPQVEVYGIHYDALTPTEELQMVEVARGYLRGMRKYLAPGEAKIVCTTKPEVKFIYEDNLYGVCRITWPCPTRRVTVQCSGSFLTPQMNLHMYAVKDNNYIVDFSHKKHRIKTIPPADRNGRRSPGQVGRSK